MATDDKIIDLYSEKIKSLADNIIETMDDGFQLGDLKVFASVVEPLILMAEEINELSGEEKKQFVKDAAWLIYRTIDEGENGKQNNINIPLLVGPVEKSVEENVIKLLADFGVSLIYQKMKDEGKVGSED